MATTVEPGKTNTNNRDTIVVDLGSKKSKEIKQLKKGKGKLMEKVNQCLEELRASNSISGGVQPVVIIVKEKLTPGSFFGMMG
jgi:hypothetical protein